MKSNFSGASLAMAAIPALILVSCISATQPPVRTYDGDRKPAGDTALLRFVNPTFISIVPYKVDGRAHVSDTGTATMEGTYLAWTQLNTEFEFLPGRHEMEFYAVDTTPLRHFVIGFEVEQGKTYLMKGDSKNLAITAEGRAVAFDTSAVPVLEEPADSEPHATLTFLPGKSGFDAVPYILRIDGKVRETMYRLHPRWTTMNYSGLARGVVTSVGLAGMLIQPNVEAKEGYLSIRIEPGEHTVEYFAETFLAGKRFLGRLVRTVAFDARAGKDYSIVIKPDAEKDAKSGLRENGIEIVEQ